eukprot:1590329-Pyramimonas_sp.AAC.1
MASADGRPAAQQQIENFSSSLSSCSIPCPPQRVSQKALQAKTGMPHGPITRANFGAIWPHRLVREGTGRPCLAVGVFGIPPPSLQHEQTTATAQPPRGIN